MKSIHHAVKLALVSAPLMASAAEAPPTDVGELDVVVVTGSRIARPEAESAVPVQIISAEEISAQGSQNIADLLQELPAFGTALLSRANANFVVNGNGVSTVNLRNAGDSRTLTLINGRRVVAGLGGDSAVDVNNIPVALIDNVEVITGGASAVYGSEAIAGVVNFVMKDDFEGVDFRAQTGMTSYGDNDRDLFSLTAGFNFGNNGNITVNGQYDRDGGLRSKNRAISAEDVPFRSSYVPQGRFSVPDGSVWTYNASNVLQEGFTTAVDGFNRNAERFISLPLERSIFTALGHVDVTDTAQLFGEVSLSNAKSRARLEPYAADNSDARLPDGTEYGGLTLDNPFIPTPIRDDMIANGATELGFLKRMNGIFDRSNRSERDYYRFVLGMKGTVADQYQWDVFALQGQTKEDTSSESGLRSRLFFALDAIAGPGGPICRDAGARADGCEPFNPFGFNSVSQASIDYIRNDLFDTYAAKIRQKVAGANFTGPVMELPAGTWRFATGVEHRRESSSETYSAETQAGDTLGNALTNTYGRYNVTEGYLETVVPLLRDAPGANSLEFEAALRYSDYSTVGGLVNWKAGLVWAPIDSLRVRAVYANAVRAPNIAELYDGQSQTFPDSITDPCEGVTATTAPTGLSAAAATYCRGLPGFTENLAMNGGTFTLDDNADRQSIEGFDGGNAALNEEKARTWTVGLVVTPPAVPSLTATVDWYRIRIKDAIQLVPRQYIVDQCAASGGTTDLCDFITREGPAPVRPRSPGVVWQINSGPVNAAAIEAAGVDVGVRYNHKLANGHRFSTSLVYSYLDKLTLQPIAGEPIENNRGQLNGDGRLGAGFKHRANLSLGYSVGGLSASWRMNYQSSIVDTLGEDPDDPDSEYLKVKAYTYHDMQVRYDFGRDESYGVYVGVDNVFNKKPPVVDQNKASNITGTETAAESYDPIGRFIYLGVGVKF